MRTRRRGAFIEYIAIMVVGILLAMLLPVWLCFSIIIGLLAFICFVL